MKDNSKSACKVGKKLLLNDRNGLKKVRKSKKDGPEADEEIVTEGERKRRKKSSSTSPKSKKGRKRAGSTSSDDPDRARPRRRASQTYIIKYQLARNPLKAEEEDLKQALLASLEQCGQQKTTSSKKQQQLLDELLLQDQSSNMSTNSKTTKQQQQHQQAQRENHYHPQQHKQPAKQRPKQPKHSKHLQNGKQTAPHSKTSSLSISQTLVPVTPASVATSTPPRYDEEYLEKYRPDTEDFLSFICFRLSASQSPPRQLITADMNANRITANTRSITSSSGCLANGYISANQSDTNSSITGSLNIKIEPNSLQQNGKQTTSSSTSSSIINEHHNLRRSVSPYKLNSSNPTSSSNPMNSPTSNRRRPPTRQSPRLANTQKISELIPDPYMTRSSQNHHNHHQHHANTALNSIVDYEEELKRASMALEDMAQEITNGNGISTKSGTKTHSQNLLLSTADSLDRYTHNHSNLKGSNSSHMPSFKNNEHLVKGLMTREFAGTFADEEIIFESISNHRL